MTKTESKTPITDAVVELPAPLPAHIVSKLLAVAEAAEEWVAGEGNGTRIAHELHRLHEGTVSARTLGITR